MKTEATVLYQTLQTNSLNAELECHDQWYQRQLTGRVELEQ